MSGCKYFFAGGGTGGHIYPAIAIAQKLIADDSGAEVVFFCSDRLVDSQIFAATDYRHIALPAKPFNIRPDRLAGFISGAQKSTKIVNEQFSGCGNAVLLSVGGYVSFSPVLAAKKHDIPVAMLNVDYTPGKANKLMAKHAKKIFIQFEETAKYFGRNRDRTVVSGCPLRADFANPGPDEVVEQLGLEQEKKLLVVTGGSSSASNINNAFGALMDRLSVFSEEWQIVHLAGRQHRDAIEKMAAGTKINYVVLDYYDRMAGLYYAADLVVGRSGAVSVAEYVSANAPAICMPYPYHRDQHQKLNAKKLVDAGCAVIVEDARDTVENIRNLWPVLEDLMKDDEKRNEMAQATRQIAVTNAADIIAGQLQNMAENR